MTLIKGTTDATSSGTDSGTIAPVSQAATVNPAVKAGGNLLPPNTLNAMADQPLNIGGITIRANAGAGAPVQGPGLRVPPGAVVRVRALPSNAGNVMIAQIPEDLMNGQADVLSPNTEVIWPIDNLARLFLSVQQSGDGVVVSVRSA